jgi:hypothetical protein
LHKSAENNSRLMRWSLRLAEYYFEIGHRTDAKIRHIDALSRHVQASITDHTLSKDVVREEQKKDKFCSELQVGKAKGRSEYFYDESYIRGEETRNLSCSPKFGEGCNCSKSRFNVCFPPREKADT